MGERVKASEAGALSLEEFRGLPEDDAFRVELSRGRLVREPRPGAAHGWLVGRIVMLLGVHVHRRELGIVVSETGFLLERDPPTVRGPDAAFISAERLGAGEIPTGFWPVAPELAVEVLSPANTAEEIQEKVLQFLEAGTRTVWVVHPEARSVTVWTPPAEARVVDEDGTLDAGDVVPGFRIEVAELFSR